MNTKQKGTLGEFRVSEYLQSEGWRIIKMNYRTKRGEIDIIAEKGESLSFVEVKSWSSLDTHQLEYAIGLRKQRIIVGCAREFIASEPKYSNYSVQFDVVLHRPCGGSPRHLQHAFTETGR